MVFSLCRGTEIKDELLGCVLFSLLWTGCNLSVLEKWKVCESPESWACIPSVPLPWSRECDTVGGNHMLSKDSSKLFVFCPLGCAVSSRTPDKSRRSDYAAQWANKEKIGETVEQINCLLEWGAIYYFFFWIAIHIFMCMVFMYICFKCGCWWTIKSVWFPSQWAASLLPKVNLSSALISIVP